MRNVCSDCSHGILSLDFAHGMPHDFGSFGLSPPVIRTETWQMKGSGDGLAAPVIQPVDPAGDPAGDEWLMNG